MSGSRPYRVLVVCTGNTCRSPMAEALLARLLEEAGVAAEVRSAGTGALVGAPANPNAAAVAADAGLDLSGHVARQLDEAALRWADTVLCMQPSHAAFARELDSAADVRVVSRYLTGNDFGIRDPIGRDRAVYAEVFGEIRDALEAFVAERRVDAAP